MGIFSVPIEIGDPDGQHFETVDALVDSSSLYTFMPRSLLRRLGIKPSRRLPFERSDGTRIDRGFGQTWIKLNGKRGMSPVIFGDDEDDPLLGTLTLTIFGLGIDSMNARLIPVPFRL